MAANDPLAGGMDGTARLSGSGRPGGAWAQGGAKITDDAEELLCVLDFPAVQDPVIHNS